MKETQTLFDTIRGNLGTFLALVLLVVGAIAITVVVEKIASKREKERTGRSEEMFSIRRVAIIGVFSAIAFVLMFLEFPLPFAPSV